MYCIHCGTKLRDGAKFCPSCGKPVTSSKAEKPVAAPAATPADHTTVKTEVKEKAIDLAKAGAKQIIAALKDNDINASAQAGEVSCKADAAQSAFMKLLKKGLMLLIVLLALPLSLIANEKLSQVAGPFTVTLSNGNPALTYTLEFDGAVASGEMFDSGSTFYQLDGKTAQTGIHGYFQSGNYITLKVRVGEDYGAVDSWEVAVDFGEYEKLFRVGQKIKGDGLVSETRTLSKGSDAVFKISVPSADSHLYIHLQVRQKSDGYKSWVSQDRELILACGDAAGQTIDSTAGDAGENGWVVPAVVIGGLAVGGLALKGKKKKESSSKESSRKEPEKKKDSDKKNKEDDNDDEENATYEMRIRKDFGDTLTPGGATEKVYARIVRIPAGGQAATDKALTAKISITGDDYLNVRMCGLSGDAVCATVEAPQTGSIPSEAVVNFRLAGAGGSFTNRMHFKVARSEIIFFQENITLPACSDEVWRLPFAVTGASKDMVVEACSNCLDKYDVKVEPGEKDGLYYAVISEKAKDKKEPGTWEPFSLGIKASNGRTEMSESIPLYRFHMGLRFDPHSTIPCYLKDGEVQKAFAELVYFDWNPETNDIVTVFPVPTEFKISAAGETEQGYLEKIGITCKPTSVTTDNGRRLEIYPVKGILDAPTRFNATITLTADCGQGRKETVTKEVLIASQPVRQNVTPAMLAEDKRIGEGLLNIQKSIWNNGEYSRLFPLYKLIDVMLDGYDGAYGYDKHQVETVKDVYKRFLNGDLAGANATAKQVTLADEMALFIDSFLQTSEEVENSMGFFTRVAVGVATLGMSDAVFTSLQVARDMKATAEKGGDTWDVFVAGVKVVAVDYAMEKATEYGIGKLKSTAKKVAPKQYEAAVKGVEDAQKKASDFFSGLTGKKTGNVIEKSKGAKSKAAGQADDAIDAFKKNPEMSDLDKKLDQVYKNGQAHGKAKVDDLQAAQWLMEANPTPENVKLYKKKVLEVQRDKFAMQQLNSLPDGNSTRAAFNGELDNVYKDVDSEVREILRKQGYDMADTPFAATSSNKADLVSGKKVTYDRDVTYKTKDGLDVPQDVAQEAYEKAFYKRTTGVDAPNGKAAKEWAQMHDQSVVQKGSKVSYEDDLNPVIKDWDRKLTNAEHTGDVMTYKSTEWFEQTNEMIKKANTLEDSGLRLDMLEQALSKRQEATRQLVKQFRYVHERDLAAQTKGAVSKISERMRFGMEVSSRLFSTAEDALTLSQVEAILSQHNLTLELLSSQLGDTLKAIG
ncbi:MAG: zinc ribbon domain-containing protein [Bacteroidia bacterium]|nr:zinc ribbon domain-containing protein [Bacteroidia bacterium]